MDDGSGNIERTVRHPQHEISRQQTPQQSDVQCSSSSSLSFCSEYDAQNQQLRNKTKSTPLDPLAPSPLVIDSKPRRKRSFSQTVLNGESVSHQMHHALEKGHAVISSAGNTSINSTSDDRDSSGGDRNKMGSRCAAGSMGGEGSCSSHDLGSSSNASGDNDHRVAETSRRVDDAKVQENAMPCSYHKHQPRVDNLRHHKMHRHHLKKNINSNQDDGSSLQVPGDDGSDRLATNSNRGVVQPATVMASRYTAANSSSTSGGSGGEGEFSSLHHVLLPPHREPGYHTIKRTLNRLPLLKRRGSSKIIAAYRAAHNSASTNTDSTSTTEEDQSRMNLRQKRNSKDTTNRKSLKSSVKKRKRTSCPSHDSFEQEGLGGGSSEGSGTDGTEGGYAGSASSNETGRPQGSCSSPSVSSSEESQIAAIHRSRRLKTMASDFLSSSSEIADFGSSSSETADDDIARNDEFHFNSGSPPLSSSNDDAADDLEESFLSAKRAADEAHERELKSITRKRKSSQTEESLPLARQSRKPVMSHKSKTLTVKNINGRPPILTVGSDIMAHVLTFLHPPEILEILTTPLSKNWQRNFTQSPELWRVLCLVEPFKANVEDESSSEEGSCNEGSTSDSESFCSLEKEENTQKSSLAKYRSLYTSFVRCMKYLTQIREDAINGRPPAYIDYGTKGRFPFSAAMPSFASSDPSPANDAAENKNLQKFMAEARGVVMRSRENSDGDNTTLSAPFLNSVAKVMSVSKKKKRIQKKKSKGPKLGVSMITGRLLGPTSSGEPGNMNLPWSCAIYSIVNWMTAYSEVEGIQTLCLKVLPSILEDEQQRQTAQTARLTDVVLRAMVVFPKSEQLHIAAFHTIVLLARPHGGHEGMLFHNSMTASGIFGVNTQHGKSGIAVMLDSMHRFQESPMLIAMSCWALVNIALAPQQKAALVKLGGIQATINAMSRHPFSAEVQFRALFALINIVIPSVNLENRQQDVINDDGNASVVAPVEMDDAEPNSIEGMNNETDAACEREIINDLVGEITSLVVQAMKNFCSSEAILNRACLVLHNLSLTDDYHTTLLWTPQCYQMLEWCITNYRTDQVLQQSATGTLHRLRMTLSQNEDVRARFQESLRTQQHIALQQAQQEARRLNEQQKVLLANAREAAASSGMQ